MTKRENPLQSFNHLNELKTNYLIITAAAIQKPCLNETEGDKNKKRGHL